MIPRRRPDSGREVTACEQRRCNEGAVIALLSMGVPSNLARHGNYSANWDV
jgi:hypothetical protein